MLGAGHQCLEKSTCSALLLLMGISILNFNTKVSHQLGIPKDRMVEPSLFSSKKYFKHFFYIINSNSCVRHIYGAIWLQDAACSYLLQFLYSISPMKKMA